MNKFQLLMWKNFRLRRHHWFMTLLELFLPIAVTCLMVKVSSEFSSNSKSAIQNRTIYEQQSRSNIISPSALAYAPKNNFTYKLMLEVFQTLTGRPSYSHHGNVREPLEGFKTETELEIYLNQNTTSSAVKGVVFYDLDSTSDEGPSKLNYAIRDTEHWSTALLYIEPSIPGPIHDNPYINQEFASLQIAINEVFTKLKTKKSYMKDAQLLFQAFPYPEYASSESPRAIISQVISFIVILTVLIVSVPLINDIIEEKDAGVKELMKLTGLDEWLIWVSWFVHGISLAVISFSIVAVLLKLPFNGEESQGIIYTDGGVLWLLLILYVIANVSFCFLFCALFQKATIATSIFMVVFAVIVFGMSYLAEKLPNSYITELSCLIPVGAFIQGFSKIRYCEMQGIRFSWADITLSDGTPHSISMSFAMLMLIFDTIWLLFLTFYITEVNPGKFGTRKHPMFIFKGLLSSFKRDTAHPLKNLDDKIDAEFIEPPPHNLEASIRIQDLYKNFGSVYAVRGVSMNIYKGEITALLGHNGAGKTTTMSILTGLTSPTNGNIYYKDMDALKNMKKFREDLGMCPQEDRLLPYLSVMDHLLFFGMLKGLTKHEATKQGENYLNFMEMSSKKNSLAKELSGGMKRKLCLSISLMGQPATLILDEPTSGIDVQSRRKIWDLLLEMRGNHTIILSTHYMEEADVLGDRIAIMNHGAIVCYGTPLFLKKAYGTGYELTITKARPQVTSVTELIRSVVHNASKEFENNDEIVYKLPLTETAVFPTLFRNLEGSKDHYGIQNMGVACTTMEHVFLKVGGVSIYDSKTYTAQTVTDSGYNAALFNVAIGLSLYLQQLTTLFMKKVWYTTRSKYNLFTRIVVPTLISLFFLHSLQNIDRSAEPALDLALTSYPDSSVVICVNEDGFNLTESIRNVVLENRGTIANCDSPNIVESLLDSGRKNLPLYNKQMVIAGEFNKSTVKLMYNLAAFHSLPVAITTFSNAFLRQVTKSSEFEIKTQNHPIPRVATEGRCEFVDQEYVLYFVWFFVLAFYTIDVIIYFNMFVNMERINGFKHIQKMSHVSPTIYWLGMLLFDVCFFLLIVVARILIYKIFDNYGFLAFGPALAAFIFAVVLFAISGLLFVYCISFLSSSKEGSYSYLFILNTLCVIIAAVYCLINAFLIKAPFTEVNIYTILYYVMRFLVLLLPPLNFSVQFIKIITIWKTNASCDKCPEAMKPTCMMNYPKQAYFVYESMKNPNGILFEVEFLIIDAVLFGLLLALINTGIMNVYFNKLKIMLFGSYITTGKPEMDNDVIAEKERAKELLNDPAEARKVAVMTHDLRKNYVQWFKPLTAVADVNFAVRPGECFGLLGVNGAGKSTTFKMLTADILPTVGDAAIEGVKLSVNKSQYLSMAGYCAQTNCFIEELTGREMLNMIASLRGIRKNNNRNVVDKWISILGLEEYQNQPCGSYSGGNKRKLCTAMSLIGDPRVVFLDEPTSGVDPVSRRKLYDVMGQSKASGQAVILTSHSMEECESLCDRITIMATGVMKCIGTSQYLKKRYAQGFSALLKLTDDDDAEHQINQVKDDMISIFTIQYCVLKDEHKGLLYYQIKDVNLLWSYLFEKMEELKSRHTIIDDYVLTDTTLEEVFISFAKSKH